MEFYVKLQELRKKSGMSQIDLADKLDVSRQAVSKWESGQALPETDKIIQISEMFHVSLDDLLKDGRGISPVASGNTSSENAYVNDGGAADSSGGGAHAGVADNNPTDLPGDAPVTSVGEAPMNPAGNVSTNPPSDAMANSPDRATATPAAETSEATYAAAARKYKIAFALIGPTATLIYMILGFCFGLWHPGWIVFMISGFAYTALGVLKPKKNKSKYKR